MSFRQPSGRTPLRIAFHVISALTLIVAPAIHAQDQSFWSFLEPGRVVTRCPVSSAESRQARTRLERLDRRIEQLEDVDPPAGAIEELYALLKSGCFLAAAETERVPRPDTALSLKRWWFDDGGRDWLESFVELPRQGLINALEPYIVIPPDARATLNLEAHRDHPLQSFLCPLGDTPCGAATRGWRLRAEAHFDAHRSLGRNEGSMTFDERPASGAAVTSRECAGKASHGEPSERYHTWRACIEERRPKSIALPLGHFTAPKDGWMIISGRRGHYGFCDTTRAYDLATGAAFISDSCSGLALKRDGSVDRGATDEARVERLAAGSVPVENLREALWMMLFRGETAEVQLKAEYYALPEGFVPQVAVPLEQNDAIGPVWASTSQTSLTWQYVPRSGSGFVGELTWPSSFDAADDHAAFLLDVAEQGFGGCARQARLPVLGKQEVRRLNDVRTEAIEELRADFVKAARKWAGLPACRPARR